MKADHRIHQYKTLIKMIREELNYYKIKSLYLSILEDSNKILKKCLISNQYLKKCSEITYFLHQIDFLLLF